MRSPFIKRPLASLVGLPCASSCALYCASVMTVPLGSGSPFIAAATASALVNNSRYCLLSVRSTVVYITPLAWFSGNTILSPPARATPIAKPAIPASAAATAIDVLICITSPLCYGDLRGQRFGGRHHRDLGCNVSVNLFLFCRHDSRLSGPALLLRQPRKLSLTPGN